MFDQVTGCLLAKNVNDEEICGQIFSCLAGWISIANLSPQDLIANPLFGRAFEAISPQIPHYTSALDVIRQLVLQTDDYEIYASVIQVI
jgi:hypothetical protein